MDVGETSRVTTPTDREIVMTRRFDAPRDPVFETCTKPELLKRWLRAGGAFASCGEGRTGLRWG